MYLIAGLGNPGPEYKNNRHNVGYQAIELWTKTLGKRLIARRFQSRSTQIDFQENRAVLICPLTFMNRSGYPVRAFADFYDVQSEDILVVHDDLDLEVGRLKVARNSSAGGHKGVQSIIEQLGTTRFSRVKIGIGRPRYGEDVENYVLSPFYADEKGIIRDVLHAAVEACEWFVSKGIEHAMNRTNCQNFGKTREPTT